MNLKLGIKGKLSTALVILMLIVITLSGGVAVSRGNALTKKLLGDQAYNAAAKAFEQIDPVKLQNVIKSMDDKSVDYIELQNIMSKARYDLNLKYLYTMTLNEKGQFIYLVDGMPLYSEDFSRLGDIEEDKSYFTNFRNAMQGTIVKGDFVYSDVWGNQVSSYIPVKDRSGRVIAFLGADMDATEMLSILNKNTVFLIFFISGICLLGAGGAFLASYIITNPITKLRDYSMKASKGEEVLPIEVRGNDEIGELAAIFNDRMDAVKNLLNNIGQGFLSFGEDLLVDPEYSMECKRIFNMDIENLKFTELIYPEDEDQRKFLEGIFKKILREKEESKRGVYLPLIADEIIINGRNICVDYKVISSHDINDEFMVILTDVTDQRALEGRIEQERDILKMVVKTIINYSDFNEIVKDYQNFCSYRLQSIVDSRDTVENKIIEVFRSVHTFKGNFAQLDMNNTAARLHEFEEVMTGLKANSKSIKDEDFRRKMYSYDYDRWMDKDMDILRGILGDQFLMRYINMESILVVDKLKLKEIEEKMVTTLSPFDCKLLLPELKKLRYKPFRELLRSYPEYVSKLSERLGKQVKMMEITGGDFNVDAEKYIGFTKSLVHLFRNALDHGIEPVDERMFKNKEEYGRIRCIVKNVNNSIHLIIADNGRGMDIRKIRSKAVEKGIVDETSALQLSYDEIMNLVFTDEFSTKEVSNDVSGRGVGLSAVKSELDKLQGTVVVKSKLGEGTEFHFVLPSFEVDRLTKITIEDVMNPLLDTTKKIIAEQLQEDLPITAGYNISRVDRLNLSKYTAFTDIKGILEGRFAMSFDERLARDFTGKFAMEELPVGEEDDYVEDCMAECLNIILGNSIKMIPGLEELLLFASPVTISSEETTIKYPEADIWTCNIAFKSGNLSLSFVTTEKGLSAA